MTQARRYNKGKLNYNLGSVFAERQVAKVSTLGAHGRGLCPGAAGHFRSKVDVCARSAQDKRKVWGPTGRQQA